MLWLNTVLLIAASVAMQAARKAVRTSVERGFTALLLGGLLTLAFLGGQFYAWGQVRESEFFSPVNPAVAFFYLLTAVHNTCSAACMSGDELSPACRKTSKRSTCSASS